MNYETFMKEKARVETLSVDEQKQFYAALLESETAKSNVRLQAYFRYALLYYHEGDFRKAKEILEPFVIDYQSYDYTPELLSCFNLMSVSHHCEGEYMLARYFYSKALDIAKEHGKTFYFSQEYNNISLTYIAEQDYDTALKALLMAQKYLEYSDDIMGAYVYLNMALTYQHLDRLDEAQQAFDTCLNTYHADELLPDDMLICGVGLAYKLGDREKYEEYKNKILISLDKMYASEFIDACKAAFDCAMADGDYALVMEIVGRMDAYMQTYPHEVKTYPHEVKVGLCVEELKYIYAKRIDDRDAMLSAMEKRNAYYGEIVTASEGQRVKSIDRHLMINSQLQAALKNEAKANRVKTKFLANMSHDIRTPMNAIVGLTDLMGHALYDEEKARDYLRKIRLSSRHMLGILNDLLDITNIESGDSSLNMEPMNLAEQVVQIGDIVHLQADEKGQTFQTYLHCIRHENLIGDAIRLRQVIVHTLTNAIKYTPDGGNIRLDIEELICEVPARAQYRFVITDDGAGMEPELVQHIFEPFMRGEDSVINRIQGTGLGMTITKKIVDMMGGLIRVESTPGKGSSVEITLGFKIDADADSKIEPMNVLLLSNDATLSDNISASAQTKPLSFNCVSCLDDAARLLADNDIDVLLLSGVPYNDSSAAMVEMLRRAAGNPILVFNIVDSLADRAGKLHYHHCGIDGELIRPFFFTNLDYEINRLRSINATPAAGNSILGGMRFLCAEDNELNAEILRSMLDVAGASCTIYPDGTEIVEAFKTVNPDDYDAILMDIQMPNLNGYEAAKQIRSGENPLGRTIPIIAITANAFTEDVRQSMASGMNAHLSKPLDIASLEKVMRRFVKQVAQA